MTANIMCTVEQIKELNLLWHQYCVWPGTDDLLAVQAYNL